MRGQLARLLKASDEPNISIQVVPYETEHHPGLSEAFILYSIHDKGTVLYIETRRTGTVTDAPDDVDDYSRLFGDLLGAALPVAASRKLIEQIQGELS